MSLTESNQCCPSQQHHQQQLLDLLPDRCGVSKHEYIFRSEFDLQGTQKMHVCRLEGYWKNQLNPSYPFPEKSEVYETEHNETLQRFISKLDLIQQNIFFSIGTTSSLQAYRLSLRVDYDLLFGFTKRMFMGYSPCRLCEKEKNGCWEYYVQCKDNSWIAWPEGLLHYYRKHKVLPSKFFFEAIMTLPDPIVNARKGQEEDPKEVEQCVKMDELKNKFKILALVSGVGGPVFT